MGAKMGNGKKMLLLFHAWIRRDIYCEMVIAVIDVRVGVFLRFYGPLLGCSWEI